MAIKKSTGQHDAFLRAGPEPEILDLPPARYIAIDGRGAPEGEDFQAAIAALYGVAYTLKFSNKKAGKPDFKVAPLEATWSDGKAKVAKASMWKAPRGSWHWKAMIRMPESVTAAAVDAAKRALIERRGEGIVPRVGLEKVAEGQVVHLLHVGPYSNEGESVERMRAFLKSRGLVPNGLHHEIYLGDPRRSKPERLKTILRLAVASVASG